MPRRNSGARSAPRPVVRSPVRNPPLPAARAPPSAPVQAGNKSVTPGLGAAIVDGLGFGTGSAVAHRAVDALMGPRAIHHETTAVPSAPNAASTPTMNTLGGSETCGGQSKALQDCLNSYESGISNCQFYMDMLQECRRNSGAVSGA